MPSAPKDPLPRTPPANDPVFVWPTPNVTDLLFYVERNGDLPENKVWHYGDRFKGRTQYQNHRLVYVSPQDAEKWSKWWYAADRCDQDEYNFRWTSTEIGGRSFQSVTRSYLIPRGCGIDPFTAGEDGENRLYFKAGNPAPGTAMRLVPEDTFAGYSAGDFVVGFVKQERAPQELDSLYVALDVTFVKRCTTTDLPFDFEVGSTLSKSTTLYYRGEVVTAELGVDRTIEWLIDHPDNAFWGVSSNGYVTEGKQLSCDWYAVDETQVVPGTLGSSSGGGVSPYGHLIRSWWGEENVMWPAIFAAGDLTFKDITIFTDKTRTKTYTRSTPRVTFKNPMYRGATRVFTEEYWNKEPLGKDQLPAVTKLMPKEIDYTGAALDKLQVQPTLHDQFTVRDRIGTNDPQYKLDTYDEIFPATVPTTWPESMCIMADQAPFRGGYRLIIKTAERPDCYVP